MKVKFGIILISAFLAISPLAIQAQPHPNGGNLPTEGTNDTVGGGAPIGGGILILMALGAAYGARKLFRMAGNPDFPDFS